MNSDNSTGFNVDSPSNITSDFTSGVAESLANITTLSALTIFLVCLYYLAILFSLVGNTIIIKTIRRIGRALRRKVHYLFIVNLSVADLLFALEMAPMICVHMLLNGAWLVHGDLGVFLCKFDVFLSAVLILTSNLTILAIAVEKFLGVFYPMKTFVSKKRAYFIIAATWLLSGLYSSPLFYFASLVEGPVAGNLTCFVCLNCEKVVQWFLFQTVLLAAGFVVTFALYSAIVIKIWLRKTPGIQLYDDQKKKQGKKHKALKMLAVLVFVFYISFIPFWISQLSLHFNFYEKLGPYYGMISAFLMLCNGTVNPIIYSVYNMDIRREFVSFFTCRSRSTARNFKPSPSRRRNNQSKESSDERNVAVTYNNSSHEVSRL